MYVMAPLPERRKATWLDKFRAVSLEDELVDLNPDALDCHGVAAKACLAGRGGRLYHSPATSAEMLELSPALAIFALSAASLSGECHCLDSSRILSESAAMVFV